MESKWLLTNCTLGSVTAPLLGPYQWSSPWNQGK